MEPSAKGSLIVTAVVGLRRERDAGRISEEQLAVRLSPLSFDLLDQKIDISRWYPIEAFCEMTNLAWEITGGGDPDFMRRHGQQTCARLFESGHYQQLDYAKRSKRQRRVESHRALVRQAKLVTSITGNLYNFLSFDVRAEDGFLVIDYMNAGQFSEALRYTTEGFMNEINRQQGSSRAWTSERVTPDLVRFRLALPEWIPGGD